MNGLEILRVVVGSQAHGLAAENSDFDYKSIFVSSTSELLKLGSGSYHGVSNIEGKIDDTSYELGHFLSLACKSNPSILEVFRSPTIFPEAKDIQFHMVSGIWETASLLKSLFPYVWSSIGVYNAFLGYSHDQRKKFFDDREESAKRRGKYAVAHLRVLLSGIELLTTGDFRVKVADDYIDNGMHLHLPPWAKSELERLGDYRFFGKYESWREYLLAIKKSEIQIGNIVDTAEYLKSELKKAYEKNPDKKTDLDKVNEYLLSVRKENW